MIVWMNRTFRVYARYRTFPDGGDVRTDALSYYPFSVYPRSCPLMDYRMCVVTIWLAVH